jgi:diaminopimelate epimerase
VFAGQTAYIGKMSETATIAFTRMNGLGNDFIIIDARAEARSLSPDAVRALAARDNAVTKGCDQLLVIHPPRADNLRGARMQIFNADGSEVEACGNGARAVAAFLARLSGDDRLTLETLGGDLACVIGDGQVEINMPLPQFDAPISLHADLPDALPVNMGNPHAVIFVPTGTAGLAAQYGFQLEHDKNFPQGANINFASLQGDALIRLDTWERGTGLTKACGTGACATAAAAIHAGYCQPGLVTLRPPFNQDDNDEAVLRIDYQPGRHLTMRGPVAFEFDGEARL